MVIAFVVMWKPFPRRDKWIEGERENKGRQLVLRTTDPRSIFDIEHFEKNKNLRGKLKGELLDHFLDHYSPTNKSREPQRKQYRSVNQYHLSLSLSLFFLYLLSSRIHGRREQLPRVDVHGILHRRRNPIRTERSSPLPPMSIRFQTYLHPYETGEGGTKVSAITQFPIRRYSSTGTRGVGIITD